MQIFATSGRYMASITITDEELRGRMTSDFAGHGRGARLSRTLGVSESTAGNLLRGVSTASLLKVAAHYGFQPACAGTWVLAQVKRDPRDVGYRHRWTELVLAELRDLMSQPKGKRPRTSDVAKRMGISQARLRGVIAAADIKLREQEGRS